MPGKHYKGMPKYKKGMPKRTTAEAKADAIEGGFDKATAEEVFTKMKKGMPKGIGNYKGSGNFAMKNKVLMKSAKHGEPMQKNFLGKAMMGPGAMLLTKKPKVTSTMTSNPDGTFTETKSDGKRTAKSTYSKVKTKTGAKNVYKNEHGQKRQINPINKKYKK